MRDDPDHVGWWFPEDGIEPVRMEEGKHHMLTEWEHVSREWVRLDPWCAVPRLQSGWSQRLKGRFWRRNRRHETVLFINIPGVEFLAPGVLSESDRSMSFIQRSWMIKR